MRFQFRLRTLLIALPALGVFLSLVLPACDAVSHGPYTTWFNHRCQRLADEAGLVGRPERDIIPVLGPPTFFYAGDDDSSRTYNYAPFPLAPTAKFQVHCENGIVIGVEQFDD